jgi:hypothetical protein
VSGHTILDRLIDGLQILRPYCDARTCVDEWGDWLHVFSDGGTFNLSEQDRQKLIERGWFEEEPYSWGTPLSF